MPILKSRMKEIVNKSQLREDLSLSILSKYPTNERKYKNQLINLPNNWPSVYTSENYHTNFSKESIYNRSFKSEPSAIGYDMNIDSEIKSSIYLMNNFIKTSDIDSMSMNQSNPQLEKKKKQLLQHLGEDNFNFLLNEVLSKSNNSEIEKEIENKVSIEYKDVKEREAKKTLLGNLIVEMKKYSDDVQNDELINFYD